MTLPRRLIVAWLIVMTGVLSGCASTALVEGNDYVLLQPSRPTAPGPAIEVIEFVWFGCSHCADMYPRMKAWARTQAADVTVRVQPAIFRESWVAGARLHHTLEVLGEWDRLSGLVFEAVQLDGLDLADEPALSAWIEAQGIGRQRFRDTYRSAQVEALLGLSASTARDYQLTGVPAFVVGGRYLTSNRLSGSSENTLLTVERLIAMVRKERQATAR